MPELTLQRIPFSVGADNKLRTLKTRTGLTPNILCRVGLCLSLEEPGIPANLPDNYQIGREINRYTLLGKYDFFFVALLVTRLNMDNISSNQIDEMFLSHLDRGIEMLVARVKYISDIGHLV